MPPEACLGHGVAFVGQFQAGGPVERDVTLVLQAMQALGYFALCKVRPHLDDASVYLRCRSRVLRLSHNRFHINLTKI